MNAPQPLRDQIAAQAICALTHAADGTGRVRVSAELTPAGRGPIRYRADWLLPAALHAVEIATTLEWTPGGLFLADERGNILVPGLRPDTTPATT